jgi:hypothetical protein
MKGCIRYGHGECYPERDLIHKVSGGVSSQSSLLPFPDTYVRGYQFDYHHPTGDIVSLIDGKTIAINGIEYDLSGVIADEIIKVEWLPSLFYYKD